MARRGQRARDAGKLLVVHSEHGLGDVLHAQVNEIGVHVAHVSVAPGGNHPLSILTNKAEKPGHAIGPKRGLHQMAAVRPRVAVRGEESIAKQHSHTSQQVGLHEALRTVNQHVGDCLRLGDDIGQLPREARVHDAGDLLTALIEIQSVPRIGPEASQEKGFFRKASQRNWL